MPPPRSVRWCAPRRRTACAPRSRPRSRPAPPALLDESAFAASRAGTPYLAPQVLLNVDHRMPVMREEIFGPVAGIMKVSSDDEAVDLMNDSDFGLTAAIWTEDEDVGAASSAARVNTGTWFMNRCDYLDPALAWVGSRIPAAAVRCRWSAMNTSRGPSHSI